MSKQRKKVADYLAGAGCEPDRRFNNLNGDRQMYFNAPSGRPIDVMVDRLTMCHVLDFRPSFDRQPLTIDAVDVLLSKLQIVELNEKDLRDIVHLLAALPLGGGSKAVHRHRPLLQAARRGLGMVADRHGEPGQAAARWPRERPALIPDALLRACRPGGAAAGVRRSRRPSR